MRHRAWRFNLGGPAPVIAFVAPVSGSTAGGDGLTVWGAGFVDGATVTFIDGGGPATVAAVWVAADQLACVTPALVAGLVTVVVNNPDGQNSGASGVDIFTAAVPWTPAGLVLSSWQQDSFVVAPLAGTASAGASGDADRDERTILGDPGPYPPVGRALNGFDAVHFHANKTHGLGSPATRITSDFVTTTVWSCSFLAWFESAQAPAANVYENACVMSQGGANPAWGIYFNSNGVAPWHQVAGVYTGAAPVACATGAWRLVDMVYAAGVVNIRVDRSGWTARALGAGQNFYDVVLLGKNTYSGASPIDANILYRWTSQLEVAEADFNLNAAYVNARYGTAF